MGSQGGLTPAVAGIIHSYIKHLSGSYDLLGTVPDAGVIAKNTIDMGLPLRELIFQGEARTHRYRKISSSMWSRRDKSGGDQRIMELLFR